VGYIFSCHAELGYDSNIEMLLEWEHVGMKIVYDPTEDRAHDEESGLAVQFVGRGLPKEATDFFKFTVGKRSHDFSATFDNGWSTVDKMFPNLSVDEKYEKIDKLSERNYSIQMDFFNWKSLGASNIENNATIFYELFKLLAMKRLKKKNIRINSRGSLLPKEYWRVEN
jgi:hypothetical protein